MRLEHDRDADAIYVWLRDGVVQAFGEHLDDSRYVDFGDDRRPVGVELLNVSRGVDTDGLPEREAIGRLLASHRVEVFA